MILEDNTSIDLLLTDLVMPQMDGRELAQRITKQAPTMRVLFMSGYTDQSVTPAGSSGLSPFLEKPFSAGDLARKVREVLDTPGRPSEGHRGSIRVARPASSAGTIDSEPGFTGV